MRRHDELPWHAMWVESMFLIGVMLVAGVYVYACTPAERRDLAPALVPLEKITCIVLRIEGQADLCATADELAPYAADLLEARAESPPTHTTSAQLAVALPSVAPPTHHRCRSRTYDARRRNADAAPDSPPAPSGAKPDAGGNAPLGPRTLE